MIRPLWNFGGELAGTCLWTVLTRLPVAVSLALLASLVLAAPPAYVLMTEGSNSLTATAALAILALPYLLAGVAWGCHRTFRSSAEAGLAVVDKRLPEIMDHLLAPLVKLGEDRVPALDISQLRRQSEELFAASAVPRWRMLRRLMLAATRWWLRSELAVMEYVLSSVERRGESHLSAASLMAFARDEIVARSRSLIAMNLRQVEYSVAFVVFALLVAPAALVSFLAG